jgi:hypothetical protein
MDEKISRIADLANLIYTSYVGRDFFAKVVPGFVGLISVGYFLGDEQISVAETKDTPLMAWLIVFGVCYAAGFTIQRFGESFGIIRLYGGGWNSATYSQKVDRFFRNAPSMYHRAQRERYVVIKELYGNLACALFILLAVLIVKATVSVITSGLVVLDWRWYFFTILVGVSIYSLLQGNRKVCDSERNWINNALGEQD